MRKISHKLGFLFCLLTFGAAACSCSLNLRPRQRSAHPVPHQQGAAFAPPTYSACFETEARSEVTSPMLRSRFAGVSMKDPFPALASEKAAETQKLPWVWACLSAAAQT